MPNHRIHPALGTQRNATSQLGHAHPKAAVAACRVKTVAESSIPDAAIRRVAPDAPADPQHNPVDVLGNAAVDVAGDVPLETVAVETVALETVALETVAVESPAVTHRTLNAEALVANSNRDAAIRRVAPDAPADPQHNLVDVRVDAAGDVPLETVAVETVALETVAVETVALETVALESPAVTHRTLNAEALVANSNRDAAIRRVAPDAPADPQHNLVDVRVDAAGDVRVDAAGDVPLESPAVEHQTLNAEALVVNSNRDAAIRRVAPDAPADPQHNLVDVRVDVAGDVPLESPAVEHRTLNAEALVANSNRGAAVRRVGPDAPADPQHNLVDVRVDVAGDVPLETVAVDLQTLNAEALVVNSNRGKAVRRDPDTSAAPVDVPMDAPVDAPVDASQRINREAAVDNRALCQGRFEVTGSRSCDFFSWKIGRFTGTIVE